MAYALAGVDSRVGLADPVEEDAVPDLVDLPDLQPPLGDVGVEEAVVVFREHLSPRELILTTWICGCTLNSD